MNFKNFEILKQVIECGSVNEVAKNLGLSPSNVSHKILALAKELGQSIYEHRNRKIVLTPDGKVIFGKLSRLLDDYDSLKKQISQNNLSNQNPTLTLSMSPGFSGAFSGIWLDKFLLNFPDIITSILVHDSEKNLVATHSDLILWPEILTRKDFKHEYLMTFHFGLFASQKYIDVFGKPKSLDDLVNHRLVKFPDDSFTPFSKATNELFQHLEYSGKQFIIVNNGIAMYNIIERGIAIGVAALERPDLKDSKDMIRLFEDLQSSENFYAITSKKNTSDELVRPVIKFFKEQIRNIT